MAKGERLNGLDLFSGIGGNTLALEQYVKTIAYCEADRHAQAVLLSRMDKGDIEYAPVWDNIKTLNRECLDLPIDIIIAGFPCQDISCAGRGAGLAGERSGLFFEIVRLAKEIRAPFLFLENVPAIRTRGLSEVIRTLAEVGYDCRWTCISAESVGAPHKRERWFLLAYAHGYQIGPKQIGVFGCSDSTESGHDDSQESLADTKSTRLERRFIKTRKSQQPQPWNKSWWAVEPNVGRVAYGVSNRVDRLKRLGNAVVPQQAKVAFELLLFGRETHNG